MQTRSTERRWTNLYAEPPQSSRITHLTDPADPQWVGIVDISPSQMHKLVVGYRHDLYVLRGHVDIDGCSLGANDFLIQSTSALCRTGKSGARLLVYREASDHQCDPLLRTAQKRVWQEGRNPLMRVVQLANGDHRVSLVEWQPGAQTSDHPHPRGEEIFVLNGELRDRNEWYPSGTWLRLRPGVRHAPFVSVPTTILLRNGHLRETNNH